VGVDAYVMPMWRYKIGDFESPLERSGLSPNVFFSTPEGIFTRLDIRGRISKWRAKREVRGIARQVSAANGCPITWVDEGDVVYAEQFRTAHALWAYIWWLERQDLLGSFVLPEEGSEAAGVFWQTEPDRPTAYPHLSQNGYFNDYFLPADFERVVKVEPHKLGGWYEVSKSVCSTPRALRELHVLDEHLRVPADYTWEEGDPLAPVKATFSQVRTFLSMSDRHGLPVIFWG
jgi:hypothetical protein